MSLSEAGSTAVEAGEEAGTLASEDRLDELLTLSFVPLVPLCLVFFLTILI